MLLFMNFYMNTMEIELKLRLPPGALDALLADPLIVKSSKTRKQLVNTYFDTPERTLAQAGISLRLRSDGKHWLQTLKGPGTGHAGLHQREEIEFPVTGPALEWDALAETTYAATLAPLKTQLVPQFTTRFQRDVRRLNGATGAKIELAMDQGLIIAGERQEALCELELELVSGPVDDIFYLALQLAKRHPLVTESRSKAQRGSQLAQGAALSPPLKAAATALPAGTAVQAIARLSVEQALAHWQDNQAGFMHQLSHDPYNSEYLHQVRVAVRRLRVACGPLAKALNWQNTALKPIRVSLRKLGQQLGVARDWDVFIEETWPLLASHFPDAAQRQVIKEQAQLLQLTARLQAQAALEGREGQRLLLQLSKCLMQPDNASERLSDSDPTTPPPLQALTAVLDQLDHQMRKAIPKLSSLSPKKLHQLRIVAKKLRYLTEFIASQYEPQAVENWLKWLKNAQTIFGGLNDQSTARKKIYILCATAPRKPAKTQETLLSALKRQPKDKLEMKPLPGPYWHGQ